MSPVRSVFRFAALGLMVVGACVRDARLPSEPAARQAPQFAAVASSGGASAATGRHIVSFSGAVPTDFTSRVEALGGKVLWVSAGSGLAAVSGLQGGASAKLAAGKGIQAVDVDESIPLDVPLLVNEGGAPAGAGVQSSAAPASAGFFRRQWNMQAVQADVIWAHAFLGSSAVTVFMLDSGIDYLHDDLVGLVDLTRSLDLTGTFLGQVIVGTDTLFVPFTEADTVKKLFPTRLLITDLLFHGTHTSATVSSNAVWAAGITSRTTLVAVKVVINMSLGGAFTKAGNGRFVGLLDKVFNYARSKGVTVVVSAGNEAADLDHDGNTYQSFCNTPSVICVSATGPTSDARGNLLPLTNPDRRTGPWTDVDAPAFYSNFGRSAINVAAPGGNTSRGPALPLPAGRQTAVWAACSGTMVARTTAGVTVLVACTLPVIGSQGTSMAAPHVAGTAALLVSILGRNPSQIKARIQQSADNVAGNGTTPFYGKGRLNVARAVGAIP